MVQEIVITVQNLLEEIASFGERIKKCVFCSTFHSRCISPYFTMILNDLIMKLGVYGNALIF